MKRELSKVESVKLGLDRGCFLTLWIFVQHDTTGHQGFGGIVLDSYDDEKDRRIGTAAGCDYIRQILSIFKADDLNEIVGRTVWVYREDGFNGLIKGIEIPGFDGGGKFMLDEWRKEWGFE